MCFGKSFGISLLMVGALWAAGAVAESRPYMQSFKCHTGFEPGRWYEFTLEIYDAAETPEPKVTRLRSFMEDPFGDRSGEVDYLANASSTFPKIRGTNSDASVEIDLGNPVTQVWDIRSAVIKEKLSAGEEPHTADGACLFIGARP